MHRAGLIPTPTRAELRRAYCLSIRQPWAWLILHGGKHLENREWARRCRHRGPIWIHAGQKVELEAWTFVRELGRQGLIGDAWEDLPPPAEIPTGALLGRAVVHGVVTASDSPWFMGTAAFVLAQRQAFVEPIPCPGSLGLFRAFARQRSRSRS